MSVAARLRRHNAPAGSGTVTLRGVPAVKLAPAISTSWDVPMPAAVVAGDILAVELTTGAVISTLTPPSGSWTLRASPSRSTNETTYLFTKTADGTEGGTSPVWTTSGAVSNRSRCSVAICMIGAQEAPMTAIGNSGTTTVAAVTVAAVPAGALIWNMISQAGTATITDDSGGTDTGRGTSVGTGICTIAGVTIAHPTTGSTPTFTWTMGTSALAAQIAAAFIPI